MAPPHECLPGELNREDSIIAITAETRNYGGSQTLEDCCEELPSIIDSPIMAPTRATGSPSDRQDCLGLYRVRDHEIYTMRSSPIKMMLLISPSLMGSRLSLEYGFKDVMQTVVLMVKAQRERFLNSIFNSRVYESGDSFRVRMIETTQDGNQVYGAVHGKFKGKFEGWALLVDYKAGISYADPIPMKEQVRINLEKPVYDVKDFYKVTGIWQLVAKSPVFENFTLFVITVNAFWMWLDADENGADALLDADPLYQVAEHCFCIYFSLEWFIRFMAFKRKRSGFQDFWFFFDSCLVGMMVFETWIMTSVLIMSGSGFSGGGQASLLRLLRLMRLSRLARMLRSCPELLIMIKGIVASSRTVSITIILLLLLMSVFSIIFRQLSSGTPVESKYFSNIGSSMYVLLMKGTFLEDVKSIMNALGKESVLLACVFLVFILLSALTVMNMLIGILCEVVSGVAQVEKELMLKDWIFSKMEEIVAELDENGDQQISRTEFNLILIKPEAAKILEETGIDPVTLVDYVDFIFETEDGKDVELSIGAFVEILLSFRNTNVACVKDAVELRKFVHRAFNRVETAFASRSLRDGGTGVPPSREGIPNISPRSWGSNPPKSPRSPKLAACPVDMHASLRRLDAYLTAAIAELVALMAEILQCMQQEASSVPSVTHPCHGISCTRGVKPPTVGIEAGSASTDLRVIGPRLARLDSFAGLAWQELEGLQKSEASALVREYKAVKLWCAMAEEMFLSPWRDCLEKVGQVQNLDSAKFNIVDIHSCIFDLQVVARQRHASLQGLLTCKTGGEETEMSSFVVAPPDKGGLFTVPTLPLDHPPKAVS